MSIILHCNINFIKILNEKEILFINKGNRLVFFNLEINEIFKVNEIQNKIITDFSFSKDKKFFIVKDGFYSINLFNDKCIKEKLNHRYKNIFSFSPVENTIAILSENNYIHILNCKNKNILNSKKVDDLFSNIDFSPDGKKVVFLCSNRTVIWDFIKNITIDLNISESHIYFSKCGKFLFCYSKKGVVKFDMETREKNNIYQEKIINKIYLIKNDILCCVSQNEILFWDLIANKHIHDIDLVTDCNNIDFCDDFFVFWDKNKIQKINLFFLNKIKRKQIVSICQNYKEKKDCEIKNFFNSNLFDRNLLPLIFEYLPCGVL
jgi:WD40 repeat protein